MSQAVAHDLLYHTQRPPPALADRQHLGMGTDTQLHVHACRHVRHLDEVHHVLQLHPRVVGFYLLLVQLFLDLRHLGLDLLRGDHTAVTRTQGRGAFAFRQPLLQLLDFVLVPAPKKNTKQQPQHTPPPATHHTTTTGATRHTR